LAGRCYDKLYRLRIGIHTSIAGSLENAALKAAELGANTFQIFTASPRMWQSRPLDTEQVGLLKSTRERLDLAPMVVHDNYLINLASADATIRARSIAAFRGELERAAQIGAEFLVAHPGSYKGQTVEHAMNGFAKALAKAVGRDRFPGVTLLLENTAGSGSVLGSRFEELAELRRLSLELVDLDIGYCLDTAHCLASGYDVATAGGLRKTVQDADRILGMERVRVIHANDSKTPLDSRVDRHANIGEGYIGNEGFRSILRHPKLRTKPFILETPIDNEGDDLRNVKALKSLCRRSRTTTK